MRQFPETPITAVIDQAPLYNLGESTGADLTIADLLDPAELAGAALDPAELAGVALGYGRSAGDSSLRELVAARLRVPAGQVLITSGAAAALFLVCLLHADGETVVPLPCYPPTFDALRGLGASMVPVRSCFDDRYLVSDQEFAAALSPRTQLVVVASPRNPSGLLITDGEVDRMLDAMARVCPAAFLLIDETFREASYGGAPAPSHAGRSPRVLTCGSLSKAYGVPGLRIGWLTASDPVLFEQARRAKFDTALSCGTVDEFLAVRILSRADELLAARGAELARARDLVEGWVKRSPELRWIPPEAGAICCVRFSGADLYASLAERQVMVAHGSWFHDSDQVMRVGFGYEPVEVLERGLSEISAALAG